ncbi:alkyl/aryl-sulfatase [Sandaracinobacteroides saxicola]|uniref:MBL fold metallo-hydrolase n=1 Tax=Sandaracinobacteroides saxicola TaxID=2759707 RepID=A0A7G5IJB7_9SPHN|nr:alkyl sulfatase dimerization domain-containing protein [Sandaracinobacteroides saxicola]QMW23459.1 MBL fold metallo-hydrolase [Sandaracinobacteroides saxicola]
MLKAMLLAAVVVTAPVRADPAVPDPADMRDFAFADQGFVATRADPLIRAEDGRPVWNLDRFAWARKGAAPPTIHPSLWRNLQLQSRHGLYKVADGVHQVRGFDVSNMTIVSGRTGYIVVDPLVTVETARAAMALVKEKLGDRPVVAVIYTHSHSDHFGGVRGVVDEAAVKAGKVAIIAPDEFPEHAASENVIAGTAMARRAQYQFGIGLEPGPEGTAGSGIGLGISAGAISLLAPTDLIRATGDTRVIDGVRFEFQMVPETEAPAEMNFILPERSTLLIAEQATCTFHNIQTPRGAPVRDALAWARYLTQALRLYAPRVDRVAMSHCAPRFGTAEVRDFLGKQRDLYKYVHDQSVRMMNLGATPAEIAEALTLPDSLAREWYNRGYYGTLSHNAKAVYDRYMGWFDGNPASLNPHPPAVLGAKMVAAFGGAAAMLAAAEAAVAAKDDRFAVTLLNHLVFAQPDNARARELLAGAYRRLGFASESAIWRNIYLMGAKELLAPRERRPAALSLDLITAMPTETFFDAMASRLNPERIGDRAFSVQLNLADRGPVHLSVRNRVLVSEPGVTAPAEVTVATDTRGLLALLGTAMPVAGLQAAGLLSVTGDAAPLEALRASLETLVPDFAIVEP